MRIAIGTRKGLWLAHGGQDGWDVSQPLQVMAEFSSVAWMPRGDGTPRLLAGARSWFWRPSVLTSDDDGATWSHPEHRAIAFPDGSDAAVKRIWTIAPDPREADVYVGEVECRALGGLRTAVPPGTQVWIIPSVAGG